MNATVSVASILTHTGVSRASSRSARAVATLERLTAGARELLRAEQELSA